MAKSKIIIEYDQAELFDALHRMQPHGFSSLGTRIVEQMLMSETGLFDAIGLAVYGVTKVERERVED